MTEDMEIGQGVVHEVPDDLRSMLVSDQAVLDAWNSLTPLARNEWICWTISTKKPETRSEHIARMSQDLKAGKRRPCCWYGCIHRTDKAVSPSVQALVVDRQRKSQAK